MSSTQREIKFRVWNTVKKELHPHIDGIEWLISGDLIRAHWFDGEKENTLFMGYNQETPFVIMQFTGLKDKNGKDIYEGDICSTDSKEYAMNKSVVWDARHARFEFDYPLGKSILQRSSIEVIGNIYENPELLTN